MLYIKEEFKQSLEIKKSKFIAICLPIDSSDNLEIALDNIKKEFPKANHYCYACIIDNFIRYSDDKEPSNTAGKPILGVLQNKNLNHILLVVVRYFGGVKLGASNLLRAYVNTAIAVLEIAKFYDKQILDKIKIIAPYKLGDTLSYCLNKENYLILEKQYEENIVFIVAKSEIDIKKLSEKFNSEIMIEHIGKESIFVES